jgi:hypothetical protein
MRDEQLRVLVKERGELLHRLASEPQLAVHRQRFARRDERVSPQYRHDPLAALPRS